MTTPQTPITELDFSQIKDNLKTFLKGQDRFKDYDFEGSNMNVLLDVLSYNTFQNNFYTNMALSEMFLDSAQLRDSVVSHAKALNYVPRSRSSSRALVNITLNVSDAPTFIVIPSKTRFIAQCGSRSFNFYNLEAITVYPVSGVYRAAGVEIFEGTWVTDYFKVTGNSNQRYVLSNSSINTNTVRVSLRENDAESVSAEYTLRTTIHGVKSNENVFYLQGAENEKYEIIFGKNTFGHEPVTNNIISAEYLITSGEDANGITSFAPASTIQGYPAVLSVLSSSEGGAEKESIESIKYYAPKSIQVQDRAVTALDYEVILKSRFPEIQTISVYGGEELDPPRFGKVVISVDVSQADGVSENNKAKYANFLKNRSPIAIDPIIKSPEFMYASIDARVYYNTKTTALTTGDITKIVQNAIRSYTDSNLNNFRSTFRISNLQSAIDSSDGNIISNDIDVYPIIPLNPQFGIKNTYNISFGNALVLDQHVEEGEPIANHKPAIRSSSFIHGGSAAFIMDNGSGILDIVKYVGSSFNYLTRNIGTVNYNNGKVIIKNLNVSSYTGSEIKLYGRTRVSTITAPANRIFTIRDADVNINVIGVN